MVGLVHICTHFQNYKEIHEIIVVKKSLTRARSARRPILTSRNNTVARCFN